MLQIELEVSYDSKYDKSAFGRISESKLKTFFENICSDIQDELGSIEIRGEFVDDYKDPDRYQLLRQNT